MNTEALQDKISTTTGGRLRQARENIGLSQQAVAERLCLKVSTIRDIENDYVNPNLDSTFLRGYIRSYARLVHISEEEIVSTMLKQTPIKPSKIEPIKNFSLGRIRKKRDILVIKFTWFILFIVISLTSAWLWKNYQVQKQNITNIDNQSSDQLFHESYNIDEVVQSQSADQLVKIDISSLTTALSSLSIKLPIILSLL
ncbi:Cytoskeleton protein RodZ [Candidatus Gullanella endobia]|uniref:Cytoskeleton protein RodZ n=1 Tax=Candidatus Gullanella endobia TaxID=1070130 RepID=A0A143WPQ6_9ENTR|nr:cytoskeleton protein RodZ [Candidatus Gullanella endobia]CUX95714.1 Cytoskeleton protein RodZ [Candidatus Gullanella endobia]